MAEEDDDRIVASVSKIKSFRQCDVQLCFCDGSVFGDLKMVDENGTRLFQLTKMSFDGHGCCSAGSCNLMFTPQETADLEFLFKDDIINLDENQDQALKILRGAFMRFRGYIWEDALREYDLLEPEVDE